MLITLKHWAKVRRSGYYKRYAPAERVHNVYVSKNDVLIPEDNGLWTCITGCKQSWIAVKDDDVRREHGTYKISI